MKILLAVDFSPNRKTVVDEFAARPWPAGTTVEVLSVVENSEFLAEPELIDKVTQRTTQMVQDTVDRLTAGGLSATAMVMVGDPKAMIVDHAQQTGAHLIVMGAQGATGLPRLMWGSVAKSVLRHAPCSVEIVRAASGRERPNVLMATDGSDCSLAAARSITDRPWPAGTEVRILSVVEPRGSLFEAAFESPLLDAETLQALREASMKRAQDAILAAGQILTGAGLKTSESISVLLDGPQHIILDEARQCGAGLIVVGSHGRRGVSRFLLGSVSESVAMHAECSVDVIRPLQAERSSG